MVTCRSIWFMIAFFLLVFINLVDFAKNFYEFTNKYLISFATTITNITFIIAIKCVNMLLQSYCCCCCCCFAFDYFHKPATNIFCLSLYFYQSKKNGTQHKRKNRITSQLKYFKSCAIFCLRNCIWSEYFSLLFHS